MVRVRNFFGSGRNYLRFSYGNCTSTQVAPYLNGSKNLTFSHNTYRVPSTSGRWWVWGVDLKWWSDWQGLGQDVTSTVSQ